MLQNALLQLNAHAAPKDLPHGIFCGLRYFFREDLSLDAEMEIPFFNGSLTSAANPQIDYLPPHERQNVFGIQEGIEAGLTIILAISVQTVKNTSNTYSKNLELKLEWR